jgi:hypothetical protein
MNRKNWTVESGSIGPDRWAYRFSFEFKRQVVLEAPEGEILVARRNA